MKKILLITTAVIALAAFFAGCKNPGGQSSSASSPQARITITVAGDDNVEFKSTERTFKIPKGKKWNEIKNQAEALIKYKDGFEHNKWKKLNKEGDVLADNYVFNADTTVYAMSKQTTVSQPPKVTITVAGDEHATPKADHTFEVDPGTKWDTIKLFANDKINYTGGYKNKTWKFNNASGAVIPDGHQFNENTTVYAESQLITASHPAQVTITVAGDPQVIHKGTESTFKVDKGETWAHAKALAAAKIEYAEGYENDTWKLTDELGQDIPDNYQFNVDTTVYAVSKKIAITITVAGDSHTRIATVGDANKLKRDYGVTWSEIKTEAGNRILGHDENYTFSAWKLNSDGTGAEIQPTHKFTADTTVYAISKRTHVILTIRGDPNIIVPNPNTHTVAYDSSWEDNKADVENLLHYQDGYKLKGWKLGKVDGQDLRDTHKFKNDTVIYALSKSNKVKITVTGDSHVRITPVPNNEFIADDGAKWKTIETEAISKITGYNSLRRRLSYWKIGNADGDSIYEGTTFDTNTVVYAVTEELPPAPVSEGVKVNGVTITGKNSSCPLPAGADASWNGVFPAGRTVTLSSYFIGKNEVTVETWNAVYYWAKENGYTFKFDEDYNYGENPEHHPITNVSWRDCIVWCNAYTELKYGTTEHCVYRESSAAGAEALKDTDDADNAYFDQTKKGYRLPTEAEWEFAARYTNNTDTNAEQYGAAYLTKVNSASGATKPIGFEGMDVSTNFAALCTETARVAVFNKWWNGTAFVAQSPPVTGLVNVGEKEPNKLGLHNMSGNASEWCWDRYSTTLSSGLVTDPIGSTSSADTYRVLRGGNWSKNTKNAVYGCMTGKRDKWGSSDPDPVIGFRLVWKE